MQKYIHCIAFMTMGLSGLLNAQAVVNETQETANLWVDTVTGSDSNPGTQAMPLQTIGAATVIALSNNRTSIGTHVTINPGVYREVLTLLGSSRNTALPMTFAAATPGTVTISGAVEYSSWNNYNSNIFTAPWPNQWGLCTTDTGDAPYEAPVVLRQEMVYVNGTQMTEVLSLGQMIYPGTFFVDETSGLLYLWPPSGLNPSVADVEVANLPLLLTISNMNGVVFRNVAFKYASSCHHSPAVVVGGTSQNVLFDTVQFDWNSGEGVAINNPAGSVSVINCTANHNGATGYQANLAQNVLWQNDVASYNNWRGAQGAYYEWGMGGAHIFSDHSETWTNFTSNFNQTHSMHWDTDVQNASANNMFSTGNLLGTLIEKNLGPINVTNSTFCGAQIGVAIRDSSNVTLSNNVIYNNDSAQILLNGVAGGFAVADWTTGRPYQTTTYNTTFTGNVFVAVGNQQLFKDGYLGGSDWQNFAATFHSSSNLWWDATNGAPFTVPTPSSGTFLNFAGWQGLTGQDLYSTFGPPATDPSIACNSATVDFPDWWLVLETFAQSSTAPTGLATTDASGKATYTASNIALGGWTGNVSLTADGLQNMPGGSINFNPPTLTANTTTIITVSTTTATPPGTYALTVLANSGDVTRTMALNVTVPATSIMLSTTSLNFANQPLKITSPAQTITVTNFGTTSIAFTSFVTTSGFAATQNCGTSLAAGRSCTINVTFTPHQSTPYTGQLTITDSDATQMQIVSLTGTSVGSPTILLSAHSLAFHGVVYGSTSVPQSITATNTGTGLLNVTGITITGPNASSFHETDTCGPPVEVNSKCSITVTMSPTLLGALSATLTINSNATNNPATFTLGGSGLTAVKVSPTSVNFGTLNVGKTGTPHTITITNLSQSPLVMSPLLVTGTNPGDFVLSGSTCGSSLAANSACTVSATYVPTSGGSRTAKLSVTDSDPTSPQSVTFTGSANAITVSPNALSFGNVVVGKPSIKTVTITNAGSSAVTFSPVQITGTNPGDFIMTNNTCGSSLSGHSACSVNLTFTPPTTGSRSASLTVTDSDLSSPSKTTLSGTGT